jgi:glutamine synthetase
MYKLNSKMVCEYIWIGGEGEIRSKTRVITRTGGNYISEWNYDASSTRQASSDGNTEGILKPVATFNNPLRSINGCDNMIVLCDTYDVSGNPLKYNNRYNAKQIFDTKLEDEPWFGLEQEYFILFNNDNIQKKINETHNVFSHYCGQSYSNIERIIVEEHLKQCLSAGLNISGINAEVASQQWEFQFGPCEGIRAADELIVARYLLERIAEKYNTTICFHPKLSEDGNGSGCHTNFSTKTMREPNGITEIYNLMDKLTKSHNKHIDVYGSENEKRLTGEYETANYNNFSWGVGTRNTSVRIPTQVVKDGCGYFEDRRPAANMDPYLVTSTIFETCCL